MPLRALGPGDVTTDSPGPGVFFCWALAILLPPENVRVILEPVRLLWARVERPAAHRLAEAATGHESETLQVSGPAEGH